MTGATTTAGDLEAAFGRWLTEERHLSPLTGESYGHDLARFRRFLTSHLGAEPDLDTYRTLALPSLRAFLAAEAGAGLDARTRARRLAAIRSFFRFLARRHGIRNPAPSLLRAPKRRLALPRPLSRRHAADAPAAIGALGADGDGAARDLALFTLLYGCGLRIGEALALDRSDGAAIASGSLRVRGKGRKERVVPVIGAVRDAVLAHLARSPHAGAEQPMFRGRRGARLSAAVVQRQMRRWRDGVGLGPDATPHALRHSFATHLLENGCDVRALADLLGHASVRTTQIYAAVDERSLLDAWRRSHPRAGAAGPSHSHAGAADLSHSRAGAGTTHSRAGAGTTHSRAGAGTTPGDR